MSIPEVGGDAPDIRPPQPAQHWPGVSTVRSNGMQIAYETFGEPGGIPVLLIMGLGTQMLAWPDDFCRQLADRGHLVIRFDNRDVGLSTHLDAAGPGKPIGSLLGLAKPAYRLVDMAKDAAGLIEAVGWPSAHIVGVSMGGMIAQNLVLLRPDLVRSLVSISSTTGSLLRRPPSTGRPGALGPGQARHRTGTVPSRTVSRCTPRFDRLAFRQTTSGSGRSPASPTTVGTTRPVGRVSSRRSWLARTEQPR